MKIRVPVFLAGAYVAVQYAFLLASFSASSHVAWATAGAAGTIMMLLGGLMGVSVLMLGLIDNNKAVLTCAAILLAGCTLPIIFLLVGASLLGF